MSLSQTRGLSSFASIGWSCRQFFLTHTFWQRNPALFLALGALSGIGFLYHMLFSLLSLIIAASHPKRSFRICFFILSLASALIFYFERSSLPIETTPFQGSGYLSIKSIKNAQIPRSSALSYQANLRSFTSNGKKYRNIPCFISMKPSDRLIANRDYFVKGILIKRSHYYIFRLQENTAVPYTFSFAELRYQVKKTTKRLIQSSVRDSYTRAFISSLATGDLENSILATRFSLTGLRHTLAISGFHYTYLIFCLGYLLYFAFSKRVTNILLLLLTSLYFLFIGENPSLFRAWIAAFIYIFGSLLARPSSAVNALGASLFLSLIFHPSSIFDISLQLSFTATLGILLFYQPVDMFICSFFPKRSIDTIYSMSPIDQIGWIIFSLVRKAFSLTVSVHILALPIMLYHFQLFSFWGLFYNLFFPYFLIPVLILTFLGLFSISIPSLSKTFFMLAGKISTPLVDVVLYGTGSIGGYIATPLPPYPLIASWLFAMLFLGMYFDEKRYQLTVITHSV